MSLLYPKIRFAFTDHPITVWACAILLRLYFELMGLRAALAPLLAPFTKTSNNQILAVDVLLGQINRVGSQINRVGSQF